MIDHYNGTPIVHSALQLAPLVFVRPNELRQAKWKHIDFKKKQWCYTISKTNTPHIVPLAKQVTTILEELHPHTQHSDYVFPSARSAKRPMSDNAILVALRSMGIGKEEMVNLP